MQKEMKAGSEEFEAFGDIFSLYKEIGCVEEGEAYWSDACTKIDEYMKKHNSLLGRELGLAIMATLTEESKEQRYSRLLTFLALAASQDKALAHDFASQALKIAEKWMKGE